MRIINSKEKTDKKAAVEDRILRSKMAFVKHQSFFQRSKHIQAIADVKEMIEKTFGKVRIYTEYDEWDNRIPYTMIKATNVDLPTGFNASDYEDELNAFDVEVDYAKGTNSYIHRVFT